MKKYQKKLLYLLTLNSRYTNKDLAKLLKVSEDTINYQRTQFLKDALHYSIFFDYRMLDVNIQHLLISLNSTKGIEKINHILDVSYINTFIGKYDLHIIFFGNNSKKDEILAQLDYEYYDTFTYKKHIKLTHILPDFSKPSVLPKNQKNKMYQLSREEFIPPNYTSFKPDKKDLLIIKELLKNPVATFTNISQDTSLSRDTIRKKIQHFIDKKFLLSFSSIPNSKYFGYHTYALFFSLNETDIAKLSAFVLKKKYVFYCEECVGKKNLHLYIWAKTPEEFSTYFKEIKTIVSPKHIDLLFFDDLLFQIEFPTSMLL